MKPESGRRVSLSMRFSFFSVLLVLSGSATGQDTPPAPFKPVFPILFPNPTGLNGYEEIVRAGDIVRKFQALNQTPVESGTLSEKRRILREEPIRQALKLLRAGIAKQVKYPQDSPDEEARFAAFAGARQLARLLMVEQYALFADGKVGEAIDSARDGLRLGYSVSNQMVIGGLVGIAVNAIMIRSIANHLDQLSARDCERLTKLAADWLAMPDPGIAALEAEREYALKQVHATLGGDSSITPRIHSLITAKIRTLQSLLKVEPWKRGKVPAQEGSDPAVEYVRTVTPDYDQVLELYARDLAKVQILGVHAAIRQYRWEYSRLPGSLKELKLGGMGIDPFTGEPLIYTRTSDSAYTLRSAKVERL